MSISLTLWLFKQVQGRHTNLPALQQRLDQRKDLRAAEASSPAGRKIRSVKAELFLKLVPNCIRTTLHHNRNIEEPSGEVMPLSSDFVECMSIQSVCQRID